MDVCNATGGDFSGNYYDGKCLPDSTGSGSTQTGATDTSLTQSGATTDQLESDTATDETTYTIENSFDTCPIIQDIKDQNYLYPTTGVFPDIDVSPYQDIIRKFAKIGIVDGYTDGLFSPYKDMSRAEFLKVVLISHCYNYRDEDPSDLTFTDVDTSSWQAKVIKKSIEIGIAQGDRDSE